MNPFTAATTKGKGKGIGAVSSVPALSIFSTSKGGAGRIKLDTSGDLPSPKNPFSSPSPKHNPFIKIIAKKEAFWNSMAGGQGEDEEHNGVAPADSGSSNVPSASTTTAAGAVGSAASVTAPTSEDALVMAAAATTANKVTCTGGSTDDDDDNTGTAELDVSAAVAPETATRFKGVKEDNGEEGERVVVSVRTKLYKLKKGHKDMEWSEVGIGPIKILQRKDDGSARLVMRREASPNGPGIHLVLNVLLKGHFSLVKHSDKTARLTCFGDGKEASSYLLKLKTGVEVADLVDAAKKHTSS